ncbi:NADH-quinone oxidoreductase subunit E [Paraphotobacterium marinum]|uniref:NADH-quinone oxidoreductase subunit E n=1 Tax=Paraphotobacterium marinum TaxID=1755811 RepID=A0A220VE12_9GAMM|nr:NADH-quinone oxidoreductase subunit NuoE [Paraphotobacterium marinum]ASK78402.1 NADH-quinone oxidoreductase subunit E [Paraphotobacterium marinum]
MKLNEQEIAHLVEHIGHYPEKRAGAIYCLYYVQDKYGYIPRESLDEISELTSLSPLQLDELITFYTLLRRRPVGRNLMRVCTSISCHIRGGEKVLSAAQKETKVPLGEITSDGSMTVLPSICLGLCQKAPVALVNDVDVLENLTPETISQHINKYMNEAVSAKAPTANGRLITTLKPQSEEK